MCRVHAIPQMTAHLASAHPLPKLLAVLAGSWTETSSGVTARCDYSELRYAEKDTVKRREKSIDIL